MLKNMPHGALRQCPVPVGLCRGGGYSIAVKAGVHIPIPWWEQCSLSCTWVALSGQPSPTSPADACARGFPSHPSALICAVGRPVTHRASLASRSVHMADTVSGSSQVLYCRWLYHLCPSPVSAHPPLSSAGVHSLYKRMSYRILLMPAVLSFHSRACVFPRIPAVIALLLCERVSPLILAGLDVRWAVSSSSTIQGALSV